MQMRIKADQYSNRDVASSRVLSRAADVLVTNAKKMWNWLANVTHTQGMGCGAALDPSTSPLCAVHILLSHR